MGRRSCRSSPTRTRPSTHEAPRRASRSKPGTGGQGSWHARCGRHAACTRAAHGLVANRRGAPTSAHGRAWWLETDAVCARRGRRWGPWWREEQERRRSRSPRVRVAPRPLPPWYRTLDQLQARQPRLEPARFLPLRTRLARQGDVALDELTSTSVEGQGPGEVGAYGPSRDGQPRTRPGLLGVVLVDGWPLAPHGFPGLATGAMPRPSARSWTTSSSPVGGGGCSLSVTAGW